MKSISPHHPIATCRSDACDNCGVRTALDCHVTPNDLLRMFLIACPAVVLGGAGIYHVNGWLLLPWLIILVGFFGLVEMRRAAAHQVSVAGKGHALRVYANDGVSKRAPDRMVPPIPLQKAFYITGFAVAWGYPVYVLLSGNQIFLLSAYLLAVLSWFTTLRSFRCSRCIHFACPLNTVDNDIRSDFYEINPSVVKRWRSDSATVSPPRQSTPGSATTGSAKGMNALTPSMRSGKHGCSSATETRKHGFIL